MTEEQLTKYYIFKAYCFVWDGSECSLSFANLSLFRRMVRKTWKPNYHEQILHVMDLTYTLLQS